MKVLFEIQVSQHESYGWGKFGTRSFGTLEAAKNAVLSVIDSSLQVRIVRIETNVVWEEK